MIPFILAAALVAGQVAFQRIPIPDGVPADMCTALAQDTDGFLWIGTQSGVVRWDGQHFKVHPPAPGESYVRTLLATSDGRVWVGTFSGGISVYGGETVTRYLPELSHARVEGFAEDRDGKVWVATQGGLDRIDPRTRRVEHFHVADERVRGLLVDRAGNLWVGTRAGLQLRRGGRFGSVIAGTEGQYVSKLFEDDRGWIWFGTVEHGASVLDPKTGAIRRIAGLSHPWVYGLTQSANEIWIATFGGGVDVVDADSLAVVTTLRNDPVAPNTIGGDRIGALLRDRSGVLWVGTWGQGIARHDPTTRAFRTIRGTAVRAMEMQDGTVWVGTNGRGVEILDRDLQRIGGHVLGDASVTCLAQAADGTIYVATLDGDLHRYRDGRFQRLTKADGLPGGAIRTLTFGPDGTLWAGAAEGLARIDENGIRSYRHDRNDAASLSGHAVEAIAFANGTMWVGTDNGLNAFDPARGTAVRVTRGLPNNWVPDLMVDRRGTLWVATHGGACTLDAWDGRNARFTRLTTKPADTLLEDGEGKVWIGPRFRIDPATKRVTEFGAADGVEPRSFYIASRSRMKNGALLFGAPEGLMVVQPRTLTTWTYQPRVVATSLRVGDREIGVPESLTIPAGTRAFRIDVAALDLTAAERLHYRYRLEGFDPQWMRTDAVRRSIAYTNLAPGRYTLRVQGTNRAGLWSPHELRLPVTVLPMFYETVWFRTVAALAVLALAYAAYRLRVRRLDARARQLERLVGQRTAELQEAYQRIEDASLTDPLTRLRNRRFLEQAIVADLEMSTRREEDLVFLLVDLDHFKSVNDTHGHAAGDAVLLQTADVLRAIFRSSDYLIRWGGEEFLIVARFIDRAEGMALAEKLRAAVEAHEFVLPGGATLRRTCSIGVAAFPSGLSWEQTVDAADQALYEAKRAGRNRVKPDPSELQRVSAIRTAAHQRRK